MVIVMKENGRIMKNMELENIIIVVVNIILGNGNTTRNMDMDNILVYMEIVILDIGLII